MLVVYIASPYQNGSQALNVRDQIVAADNLIGLGYAPIAPLLSHFIEISYPHLYGVWIRIDLELIRRCDVVLRLPGKSPGADKEIKFAKRYNIPVVFNIDDLVLWERRGKIKERI